MKTYPELKHHDMKIYGLVQVEPPAWTSPLDGDEWSASHPSHFSPREKTLLSTG
jgi:hypothetical protein